MKITPDQQQRLHAVTLRTAAILSWVNSDIIDILEFIEVMERSQALGELVPGYPNGQGEMVAALGKFLDGLKVLAGSDYEPLLEAARAALLERDHEEAIAQNAARESR